MKKERSNSLSRREVLSAAGLSTGAVLLGCSPLFAQGSDTPVQSPNPSSNAPKTSFAPLKQVVAGLLNVGYAELGPASGKPVILLHGWPYDIHTYAGAAHLLAGQGYRVIVPYLRGYGTTRFLSGASMRNGQQSALALDVIALMDALQIDRA